MEIASLKYGGDKMDINLDELMNSWSLNRALDRYHKEYRDTNNQLLENMQNQLQESFVFGYNEGIRNGVADGVMEAKLKKLVKLVVQINLEDQIILKVLEKEEDKNFIDALKQVRKKQSEQK